MNIIYPTGVVTQYYGRNPIIVPKVSRQVAIAPHLEAQRWTYTVPTGRNAIVTSLNLWIFRNTVAAPAGVADIVLYVTSGGAPQAMYDLPLFLNTVGANLGIFIGQNLTMLAGHTISLYDVDGSTGGTVSYYGLAQIVEFTP